MRDSMRRLLIDRLLTERKIVTFEELTTLLKASAPTVKRDLRYMREILGAPIVYSRVLGGYSYDPGSKNKMRANGKLSPLGMGRKTWYSPQELFVLVKMTNLLSELAKDETSAIYQDLEPLKARVLSVMSVGGTLPSQFLPYIKIVDESSEGLHGEPDTFASVGAALSSHRRLQILYENRARQDGKSSIREVSPLRLVHYRNRWYVDTYCHTTTEFRTFAIENIRRAEILTKRAQSFRPKEISDNLDSGYGLFRGKTPKEAVLLFDRDVAMYIRRQTWHPKQRMVAQGSSLRVTVPYSDPTELVGEIMRWGNHVTVAEPKELRETVRESLQATFKQYQSEE